MLLKKDKIRVVEELTKKINSYKVVGIVDMHKIPARQLQKIKNSLAGKAEIKMARKKLMKRAIELSEKKNATELEKFMEGQPAFIFTNENPFRIYNFIKKNKSSAAAKVGDVVEEDIIIKKGPTQLAPGPAISQLQSIGLKTTVEDGKIVIQSDKVVLKKGETVTKELANVFTMLKMEPMKIGLNVLCMLEDGIIYSSDILDIDEEGFKESVIKAVNDMMNLSINTGYIVELTAELVISKAFNEARTLATEANILEKEFVDILIAKAVSQARVLEERVAL